MAPSAGVVALSAKPTSGVLLADAGTAVPTVQKWSGAQAPAVAGITVLPAATSLDLRVQDPEGAVHVAATHIVIPIAGVAVHSQFCREAENTNPDFYLRLV